jgi:hypothetical protein
MLGADVGDDCPDDYKSIIARAEAIQEERKKDIFEPQRKGGCR